MKSIVTMAVLCGLLLSVSAKAQDMEVPGTLPTTKEEFVKSEPDFIKAALWLEKTPIGTSTDKRKQMNGWVLAWITNSPTVTITVLAPLLKPFEKNPDLMIVFMGGYARYVLQNNYSKDELKCNTAGMKSAVNCFNLGGDLKKDKNLSKVADEDKDGKLEKWVEEAMKEGMKDNKNN